MLTEAPDSGQEMDRIPCPYCKEMIVVGAKKCRFCGEPLDKEPAGAGAALNIWAMASLFLALLSTAVVLLFILLLKEVRGGFIAGAVGRTGGVGMSVAGSAIGLVAAVFFVVYAVVIGIVAERIRPISPALSGALGGGEKYVTMICTDCGHVSEISALEQVVKQTEKSLELMSSASDINAMLDKVEKEGVAGFECPNLVQGAKFCRLVTNHLSQFSHLVVIG